MLIAALAAAALEAPAEIVSPAPARVAVTIYRDPSRGRFGRMDLARLGGFALVTETRTVRVPAGVATLRFEGVAGGIVPASAIVAGLPGGVIEKNRDARLLSPAALVDGTLGRQVTLLRTDRASGIVRAEEATVVAGPGDGVVLRTAAGIVTLGCSGLAEHLRFPAIPRDLSARPVLSVRTASARAATARVTLSYLASGFDWSASYVATLRPQGTLDLLGWATLANGNAEGFTGAGVNVVAGRVARQDVARFAAAAERLRLNCYPLGTTTSDLPRADEIVVTASRRFGLMLRKPMAAALAAPPPPPPPPPPPEDLGDLKLYRVPTAVTVAAQAQKQVALLAREKVPFARVYRFAVEPGVAVEAVPARIVLELRNDDAHGLGLPLPAGTTALYAIRGEDRLLLGLGTLGDTAAGERLRIAAGTSGQVLLAQVREGANTMRITLTNANAAPVAATVAIGRAGQKLAAPSTPLARVDGVATWAVTLAAGGSAELVYAYDRPGN